MEALVNGTLPPEERELAEQHIASCEGCRLELELVRAIGSQEKAPAAGKDDWTLDRIFGSEGAQGKESDSAPAPAAPAASAPIPSAPAPPQEPHAPPPSMFPTAAPPASPARVPHPAMPDASADSDEEEKEEGSFGGKAAAGAPTSWDFEPADAKSDGGPSEESLFFAEEALTRRKDPEPKKTSGVRVLLWGMGGLIGAILLAFSSWFVLHMSASEPQDSPAGVQAPAEADSFPGDPGDPSPDSGSPDPTLQSPDGGQEPGGYPETPDQTAKSAPPSQAPRVSASSTSPAQPLPSGTRAPSPATTSTRSTPPPAARVAPSGTATQAPAPSGTAQRGTAQAPKPAAAALPVAPEMPRAPRTVARPMSDEIMPGEVVDDPVSGELTAPGTKNPPPETAAPTHHRVASPVPSKPSEPEQAPAPAPDNSPIGLLRSATAAAEEKGDLVALRRLRSDWKSFMSKIVGPDRARAKRDYADCLWAIQALSGRRSDQKDALAAYREYLLGAPAGGADSRTVSRLRQLEDALTPGR